MFYCRNCNEFICLECNIKYPIHNEHKIINLENGNLKGNIEYDYLEILLYIKTLVYQLMMLLFKLDKPLNVLFNLL